MSQSNTHSSADVLSTRRFAMKAAPCGVSMEEVDPDARGFVYYLCSDIDPAVAALIARNAELEAERDALAAERDKQQDTSREWAQRASALAAENKALQSRLSGLADHCRRVYDIVPQLPIDERSMEGATDALHAFCIMLGVNSIDIDAAVATPTSSQGER